jgi:sulfonate transport system substrate-binding protein
MDRRYRRTFLGRASCTALAVSGLIALVGCGSSSSDNTSSQAGASTAAASTTGGSELVPYTVKIADTAYPATLGALPVLVAQEKGMLDAQKLKLDITVPLLTTDAARAVQLGQADFGAGGMLQTLGAFGSGLSNIRLVGLTEAANNQTLMVKADSPIKSLADLKGKKLGLIGNETNTTYYMTEQALKSVGLTIDDVKIVYFAANAAAQAAVTNGLVDAGYNNVPPAFEAEAKGQGRVLWSSSVLKYPAEGLFTSAQFAQKNPQVVKQFLTAVSEAQQWIQDNPDETAELWAKAANIDVATAKKTLSGVFLEGFQVPFSQASFDALLKAGVSLGTVKPDLTYDQFVDPSFAEGLSDAS